jgi:hypothetical protein
MIQAIFYASMKCKDKARWFFIWLKEMILNKKENFSNLNHFIYLDIKYKSNLKYYKVEKFLLNMYLLNTQVKIIYIKCFRFLFWRKSNILLDFESHSLYFKSWHK